MVVPSEITSIAQAIALGGEAPAIVPDDRRDIGRIIDGAPEVALACMDALLKGPQVARALTWLEAVGALGVWLPEVQALVGFHTSSPVHHKDLWAHTLEVLERTPPDPDLRWVALLHDIGKVATRHIFGSGQVSFHGHERLGAWLAQGIAARFTMTRERAARIAFIVEHHARVNAYERGWTDRAVRRLVRDAGEHLDDMLRFSSADYTTKRARRASRIQAELSELKARIEALRLESEAVNPLPERLGKALCEGLGLRPGPEIGQAIAWLKAEIVAGRLKAHEPHAYYVKALKAR